MTQHPDHRGAHPIDVISVKERDGNPALVCLTQCFGSMSFFHRMTPKQAYDLANALMNAADAVDPS